jgi:polysaccharide export outer membrane protein
MKLNKMRRWNGPGRLAWLLVLLAVVSAGAQTAPVPTPAAPPVADDGRYRIGPGDVLDIRVYNRPQLSRESVRVEGNGMIRMPMIDDDIRAACQTEIELEKEIAKRYLRYIRRPQVQVFIKEYQSQPVAVLGAVRAPQQFKLQRRVRLLELLSLVGGPSEIAGRTIQVVHTAPPSLCEVEPAPVEDDDAKKVSYYKLNETLSGLDAANPVVKPGDIVNLAEADQIYIVGNVFRPTAVLLRDPLTVTQAIAKAGGIMPDTKKDKVRIIRQFPGSATKTEVLVDLKAIEKKQANDPFLQPNDIIDVPASEGKKFVRSLLGAVAPGVGQLPVRVVP